MTSQNRCCLRESHPDYRRNLLFKCLIVLVEDDTTRQAQLDLKKEGEEVAQVFDLDRKEHASHKVGEEVCLHGEGHCLAPHLDRSTAESELPIRSGAQRQGAVQDLERENF